LLEQLVDLLVVAFQKLQCIGAGVAGHSEHADLPVR
jgi:hypothetical protein